MNLIHLKYAVEVEKAKSITKAAENLYMGQPNLSRAIKDLEKTLGIKIFKRSSSGVIPTIQGKEFLNYAKNILSQVEQMEALYKKHEDDKLVFNISIPRASYISYAFAKVVDSLDLTKVIEFSFSETNNWQTINDVVAGNVSLGIIRYPTTQDRYFKTLLNEKDLQFDTIHEFKNIALMSKSHPLANKQDITYLDLSKYIEISHRDNYIPSLPLTDFKRLGADTINKRIYVLERGSQFDLLSMTPTTYMWGSAVPSELLKRYSLVQVSCKDASMKYKDVLIYPKNYKFTKLDQKFLEELNKSKEELTY